MRIGSLFSGYGGLDLGVMEALGGSVAWHVEFDAAPSKILAHHWPHVPNFGDVTAVDWAAVEPVDIITGGSPCQDLSHAGKRAGMTEGTRSNLWVAMREAIAVLRPSYVVWENVRGALSAAAASELEPGAGLLGDGSGRPALRALGRVLGDLASLGYDAGWFGLRAADVGAPHGRWRVFVLAHAVGTGLQGQQDQARTSPARFGGHALAGAGGPDLSLLPTPVSDNSRGLPSSGTDYASLPNAVVALLPTPRATDGTKGGPNQRGTSGDLMLPSAVQLLPTPRASDGPDATSHNRSWSTTDRNLHAVAKADEFGQYAPAIARWESTLGRPAPSPTEPGRNGPRLSPRFVEWMMGLPDGHVTGVDISRNAQLKALGNGVVPQQAAAALRHLLNVTEAAA